MSRRLKLVLAATLAMTACKVEPSEPKTEAEASKDLEPELPRPALWISYPNDTDHATTSTRISHTGGYEYTTERTDAGTRHRTTCR
ncbi:hypothetical protein [Enhygromyxa salina]|uniref:Uncharacterized protein n=1 Tax=Enhygromyxa salina TaxID=215803 RepID=A0A2S9XLD3_9BACT|nr:hypothetical protein [Enhygromyxa salina]PRP93694.1 hypothetical protein ENSA7_81220 [Enhygromyxa salina]